MVTFIRSLSRRSIFQQVDNLMIQKDCSTLDDCSLSLGDCLGRRLVSARRHEDTQVECTIRYPPETLAEILGPVIRACYGGMFNRPVGKPRVGIAYLEEKCGCRRNEDHRGGCRMQG